MQLPLQPAVAFGCAIAVPNKPAAQLLHTPDPVVEYCPAPHTSAVLFVDPAGQEYPTVQVPLQLALVSPCVAPYRPAAQLLHTGAPACEYCPTPHNIAVLFVDPAGQE